VSSALSSPQNLKTFFNGKEISVMTKMGQGEGRLTEARGNIWNVSVEI